jgi:hypothetical protein
MTRTAMPESNRKRESLFTFSSPVHANYMTDGVNDVFQVGLGHAGIERQRYNAIIDLLSSRQVASLVTEMPPIERVKMHRYEMHAGADIVLPERLDELSPVDPQLFQPQANDV